MAELAGLIGTSIGVAAFAAQMLDCICKIYEVYQSFKSCPKQILLLLDDLEISTKFLVLSSNELNITQHGDFVLAYGLVLQYCQAALQELSEVLRPLRNMWSTSLVRRNVIIAKTFLRKSILETATARLDRARIYLILVEQIREQIRNQ